MAKRTGNKGKIAHKGELIDTRDSYASWKLGEYADLPDTDPQGAGVRVPVNHARASEMAYGIHTMLDRLESIGDDVLANENVRDLSEAEYQMQKLRDALLAAHDESDLWTVYGELVRACRRWAGLQAQEYVLQWRREHGKVNSGRKARGT